MPTIAVVGAGPGLGLSIAKVFGRNGFQVALISRNADELETLVTELAASGVTAAGFAADVADPAALSTALADAVERFGPIDVLEYSPHAGLHRVEPTDVTVDNLRPDIEAVLYGAVTATQAVLPTMLAAEAGTLIYTMGGGAVSPYPMLATMNAAQAALRNWVHNLGNIVADKGIHAATVLVNAFIGAAPPAEGIPYVAPDDLAEIHWDLHTRRDRREQSIPA